MTPAPADSQEAGAAPQPAQLPAEPAHTAVTVVEKSLPVAVEPAAAPAYHAPVDVTPAPRPAPAPVQAPQTSSADIDQALKDSGLQLVQTRPDARIEMPSEPEFVPAKRPRRPPPADLGQPMQIVETHKES